MLFLLLLSWLLSCVCMLCVMMLVLAMNLSLCRYSATSYINLANDNEKLAGCAHFYTYYASGSSKKYCLKVLTDCEASLIESLTCRSKFHFSIRMSTVNKCKSQTSQCINGDSYIGYE